MIEKKSNVMIGYVDKNRQDSELECCCTVCENCAHLLLTEGEKDGITKVERIMKSSFLLRFIWPSISRSLKVIQDD